MNNKLKICFALLILLLSILNACSSSVDPKKIVGTWEYTYQGISINQIFSSDNTYKMTSKVNTTDGTWAIKGDQLKITLHNGKGETVSESPMVLKIIKLNDSVLVYEPMNEKGETGKTRTFKRVSDKSV